MKRELLDMLKEKNYAEGREIVKNYFSLTEQEITKMEQSFQDKTYADFYCYKDTVNDNWVSFTCNIIKNEEEIIYEEKGYWAVCENDEVMTELEI